MKRHCKDALTLSRRTFLGAAALGAVQFAGLDQATAQAPAPRFPSAVRIGVVGAGLRGQALIRVCGDQVVAVCDVDEARLRTSAALAPPGVRGYPDYRALLNDQEVTAVVVASPDHWHALHAIHAMEAGKDVYIAMPVCHSLGEGLDLLRSAETFGAVVGVGHEGAAWDLSGLAGERSFRMWAPPQHRAAPPNTSKESYAPWDGWLGPAESRPLDMALVAGAHRYHPDFGSGHLGIVGSHFLYQMMEGGLLSDDGPISANTTSFPFDPGGALPETIATSLQLDGTQIQWEQSAATGDRVGLASANGGPGRWSGGLADIHEFSDLQDWLSRVEERNTSTRFLKRAIRAAACIQCAVLSGRLGQALQWSPEANRFLDAPHGDRLRWQPRYSLWRHGLESVDV